MKTHDTVKAFTCDICQKRQASDFCNIFVKKALRLFLPPQSSRIVLKKEVRYGNTKMFILLRKNYFAMSANIDAIGLICFYCTKENIRMSDFTNVTFVQKNSNYQMD